MEFDLGDVDTGGETEGTDIEFGVHGKGATGPSVGSGARVATTIADGDEVAGWGVRHPPRGGDFGEVEVGGDGV